MFNLSYTTEYKGPPLFIELEKRPYPVFGCVTDIYGKRWHLNGQIGKYLLAAPYDQVDRYWTSTDGMSNSGLHQQTWLPYELIIVKL